MAVLSANRLTRRFNIALMTLGIFSQSIVAQTSKPANTAPNDKMVAIKTPDQPDAIELGHRTFAGCDRKRIVAQSIQQQVRA